MHVISRKKLAEAWAKVGELRKPLESWAKIAEHASWASVNDVQETFPTADQVGKFTVFNILGNRYRLICAIHFNRGKVYIRHVLTHAEYDRGRWKDD